MLIYGQKILLDLYLSHGNLTTHIIVASAIHLTIISKINHEESLIEEHVDNAISTRKEWYEKRAYLNMICMSFNKILDTSSCAIHTMYLGKSKESSKTYLSWPLIRSQLKALY